MLFQFATFFYSPKKFRGGFAPSDVMFPHYLALQRSPHLYILSLFVESSGVPGQGHIQRIDSTLDKYGSFNGYTEAGTTDAEVKALRRVSTQLCTTAAAASAAVAAAAPTFSRRPGNGSALSFIHSSSQQ